MAITVIDEVVSGQGEIDSGEYQMTWMDIHVTQLPDDLHRLAPGVDDDRFARLGWVSFGYGENNNDDGFRNYWRAPIWIEFENFHWTPIPAYFGGDLTIWTTRFRYSLAEGAEAHIWVYGY